MSLHTSLNARRFAAKDLALREGLTMKQIAKRLGVQTKTVKGYMSHFNLSVNRGRAKMSVNNIDYTTMRMVEVVKGTSIYVPKDASKEEVQEKIDAFWAKMTENKNHLATARNRRLKAEEDRKNRQNTVL